MTARKGAPHRTRKSRRLVRTSSLKSLRNLSFRQSNNQWTDVYKRRIQDNSECTPEMTFQECELAILRRAVDDASNIERQKVVKSPAVRSMISILETFLRRKKLICYGGISINAVLDKTDQFYDFETEIPDYDFFSKNALEDAKELANLYFSHGFDEVEAKSGVHHGTYKVFVNFIGIADITMIHKDIFDSLRKQAVAVNGIYYCPPNYLRMSMYLELSRPMGDVSRWEKVLKRLTLLNRKYPLKAGNCNDLDYQRALHKVETPDEQAKVFDLVKSVLIEDEVVFFGSFAISLYSQYMPRSLQSKLERVPDFDVLSLDAEKTAKAIQARMNAETRVRNVRIKEEAPVGEIISTHYRIVLGKDTVATIYQPMACHSYNEIEVEGKPMRIATIDTMLSLYLAFLYSKRSYYDTARIVCLAQFLFEVQQKNKLNQTGLLKRFTLTCYGNQQTLQDMRAQKSTMFNALRRKRTSREYMEWFLRYRPDEMTKQQKAEVVGKRG